MIDIEPDPPRVSPMVDWTVYDLATGAVRRSGAASPEDAALQAGDGEAVILEAVDAGTHYLVSGTPTPRPVLAFDTLAVAADGVDSATLLLPGPFVAVIDGVAYELTDLLEIASDMPATYRVVIRHFPWRDFRAEIVAS
ncbi:MAG: hypothetical protein U1E59_02150 [Amaricoccus sp.]